MKAKVFLLALLVLGLFTTPVWAQFGGGTGSLANPYQISKVVHLWNVRDYLSSYFVQTAEIDLATTDSTQISSFDGDMIYNVGAIRKYTDYYAYYCIKKMTTTDGTQDPGNTSYWTKMWKTDLGWDPIGNQVGSGESLDTSKAFTGQYDGNGRIVYNLFINRGASACADNVYPSDGEDNVGLFGFLTNTDTKHTEIKKLTLINPRVTGKRGTGSLVGKVLNPARTPSYSYTVYVTQCSAIHVDESTSYVKGFGATGGLVGANNSDRKQKVPYIRISFAKIPVSATHPNNYYLNPNDYFGNPVVYNPYNIKYGGLVGCNENGVTQDSYARGNVSGGDRVGGLAGCTIEGAIFRSYSTGTVTRGITPGSWQGGIGGLVGRVEGSLPPGLGGTQGKGSVQDCYWDTQTSGTSSSAAGTGKTTTEMKTQSTFVNWDFTSIWYIDDTEVENDGYPLHVYSPSTSFYYRTRSASDWTNGINWSDVSAWEYSSDNLSFADAVVVPDLTNSISILINHHVLLNIDEIIDQTTVSTTGKLTVQSGKTLQISNGAGTDFAMDGELVITGVFTVQMDATATAGTSSQITFNGSTAQSTGTYFPSPVNNMDIDNASGVTFTSAIVINGVLTVLSGSVSGTTATDGYHSVALNYLEIDETGSNISDFVASTSVVPANFPEKIERQWTISGTISSGSKDLSFYWDAADDHNYDWTGKTPSVYVGSAEYTPSEGNYDVSADPRWVTITVANFEGAKGTWTIGESNEETLPVELSAFTASLSVFNQVELSWVTQSETNVSGFRIYRGFTGEFDQAEMLNVFIPATNTSQMQYYLWTDSELEIAGTYYYWLENVDLDGISGFHGPVTITFGLTQDSNPSIPIVKGLNSVYPNPFNPDTTIRFGLVDSEQSSLNIYNLRGQLVRNLVDDRLDEGIHELVWDGRDSFGRKVASGMYLLRLSIGKESYSTKLMMMK